MTRRRTEPSTQPSRAARNVPPLWTCPRCGERFTTRNQQHSCGQFDIELLFARSLPVVRRLYDRFVHAVQSFGPVRVIPQKTRIALQVRMRFAALMPQKAALKGHLVLARRVDSARFERIETYSPRNHVHVFRLVEESELDAEFARLLRDAYRVGCGEHLRGVQTAE